MLDRLEDRLLLSADGSFPPAVDTNQDGLFEPFDALILLNAVNSNTDVLDAPHLDLNEDGALSTTDVDLIIGSLNSYYGGDWDAESIAALDDVTLAISDTVVSEGAAADVTVSLVQPSSEPVEVMVWSEGGTAHAYEDFEATYVYLLFEPGGPTSQTVSVATMLDGVNEGDETFLMRASRTGGTTPAEAVATVTLHDVDLDLPSLSVIGSSVHEGDSATVTLTLDSVPATDLFITVWTADGTATGYEDYEDYESLSTDYYWIAGDPLSQTFTIPTVTDSVSEGDEAFTVYAGVGFIGATTSPVESSGSVTILDGDSADPTGDPAGDDPTGDAPTLTVSDVTVSEGDSATVTVTLSSPPSDPLSLYIGSESITATEGSDYDYVFDYLTFEPGGPLTQTIEVPTLGDNEAEDDETFRIVVANSMSYESVTGTVTITDIAPPTITVSDTTVLEGEVAIVTVSLSSSPAAPLSLSVSSESTGEINSAQSGIDYEYFSAYLTFEPDGATTQTIEVTTFTDDETEDDEPFRIVVTNNSTYATNLGIVTITEDGETCDLAGDQSFTSDGSVSGSIVGHGCEATFPVVSIEAIDDEAFEWGSPEGKLGVFRVSRTGDISESLSVRLKSVGDATWSFTGVSPDFKLVGVDRGEAEPVGTLTIPPGKPFIDVTLDAFADEFPEGDESATLEVLQIDPESDAYTIDTQQNEATVTIKQGAATVSIEATDPDASDLITVPYDGGEFTVTRTGSTVSPLTVYVKVSGGAIWYRHAGLGHYDYTMPGVTDAELNLTDYVTIPAGHQSVEIAVSPHMDIRNEGEENVTLSILQPPSYGNDYDVDSLRRSDSVSIRDDAVLVHVQVPDHVAYEHVDPSRPQDKKGIFEIFRSGEAESWNDPLEVSFSMSGDAEEDTDYTLVLEGGTSITDGTVQIPAEAGSVKVILKAIADNKNDNPQRAILKLDLSGNGTYALGTGITTGAVRIEHGDPMISVVAHDPMAAESGADTGTFRIERSYLTSEPVTVNFVMSDAEGHAIWGDGSDDDYVLQNATYSLEWTTWFGWTWVGSATILSDETFVDVVLVPNADSIDEPIEPAQLTIIAHGSELNYGIDQTKATATVNIVGEHACRSAVDTPHNGQTCLIVDQVDVFISFTVSDAINGTYSSKYKVPNDVFELLETENLANEESDDLWEKIKEWGEENWDEVTGIPIPLQRFAQFAIPSANIAQTEIRRLDVEFSAVAKGTRYRYSGTASDGEWELDDSSGSSSFESKEKKIVTKTKTFDYNVSVLDLHKHRQGGMWELVTRLHLMFRQLHSEMLADPPDIKDEMGQAVESEAQVDVVHWLGEEESE